jgi:hypothetical protein
MKKVLLIMMLLLVPFQFSWAVAGEYCQHENGPVSLHFGHHTHHHQGKADRSATKSADKPGKIHLDCGSCHSPVWALFMEADPAPAVPLIAGRMPPIPPDSYTSHIPDGSHKPDRLCSA